MSRITVDNVAAAIRKVRGMSVKEKEALADEIYLHQPHLLSSCLVQSRLGVEPAAVEFLLNILFVSKIFTIRTVVTRASRPDGPRMTRCNLMCALVFELARIDGQGELILLRR